MNINDELGELTASLSQLHDSLHLDGILLQPQLPPMGRLFEKGNQYARRYGIETIAMACALRSLGCSLKGIAKTMKATGEQAPSLPTISAMVYADKYKRLREQPQCLLLTTQYIEAFESAFRQMPGWRPSAAALVQVKSNPGQQYRGTPMAKPVGCPEYNDTIEHGDRRNREAAARRAKARTAGQYPS